MKAANTKHESARSPVSMNRVHFCRVPFISILAVSIYFGAGILPAKGQFSFDQLSTFVPIGDSDSRKEKNEQLARTLKNEQDLKFRTRVLSRRGIVLVEFCLPTCPACDPTAKSILQLLAKFGGKVDYIRLDLNKNLGLSYKYDVPEVPAVLLFRDGQLEQRYVTFTGLHKAQLTASIDRLLTQPSPDANADSGLASKTKLTD